MLNLSKSEFLNNKATHLIPGLAHTFSKAPYSYVEGIYPSYLKSGSGSHVMDVDGNDYIDYVLGLGPIILGYGYPTVNEAIVESLKEGITFSMPHYLEIELAELICSIIPSSEMVKFTKTGSDAVTAAVRAARALTKRDKIAYCGGAGVWHDWAIVITTRNLGIPKFNYELIKTFQYNNIESLQKIFEQNKGEIAAVCIEPMVLEEPKNNFLNEVKKITHENNSILIFDEVVTGFRMALGGAQEFFNVLPDISCFGKGIANGMPLGAVVGKKEYMKIFHEIFYSTTYAGEILSLAAGKATIETIREKNIPIYLKNKGNQLKNSFQKIIEQNDLLIDIVGCPHRLQLMIREQNENLFKSILLQECVERGIIFGPGAIMHSYSHSDDDTKKTVEVFSNACEVLKKALNSPDPKKFLRGKPMRPVLKFLD